MKDGKGGTGDVPRIGNLQSEGDRLGEGRFPGSEIALETDHISGHGHLSQIPAESLRLFKILQEEDELFFFKNMQMSQRLVSSNRFPRLISIKTPIDGGCRSGL